MLSPDAVTEESNDIMYFGNEEPDGISSKVLWPGVSGAIVIQPILANDADMKSLRV